MASAGAWPDASHLIDGTTTFYSLAAYKHVSRPTYLASPRDQLASQMTCLQSISFMW